MRTGRTAYNPSKVCIGLLTEIKKERSKEEVQHEDPADRNSGNHCFVIHC